MADPNGKVNTNYDKFGICGAASSSAYLTGAQTYAFGTGGFPCNLTTVYDDGKWNTTNTASNNAASIQDAAGYDNSFYTIKGDPRTGRFGMAFNFHGPKLDDVVRRPATPGGSFGYEMTDWLPRGPYSVTCAFQDQFGNYGNNSNLNPAGGTGGIYYPGMWSQNNSANGPGTYNYDNGPGGAGSNTGVVRPGDDYYTSLSPDPAASDATTNTTGKTNIYQMADARPIVINRPFQSVGELGYVFRDMPFKSLDMCSSSSVDAALLDFFTVDPALSPMVAGKVNVNTRQAPVLASILNGSFRKEDPASPTSSPAFMTSTAATTIAAQVVASTMVTPLKNKAELVTSQVLAPASGPTTSDVVDVVGSTTTANYPSIKTQREAPIRALADVANSRTWNLCVDVIAQTGQYPPNATSLSKFQVTGEHRYWLHVAIDRYTGTVIDKQMESVP